MSGATPGSATPASATPGSATPPRATTGAAPAVGGRTRTGSVEFHGVWKRFRYGEVHDSLRDLLPAIGRRALGRTPSAAASAPRDFWAVRDVSFSVRPGEALGLIGANGAGKSTLLKLLTRVLEPTRGRVRVRGRLGALLEVTAGFHPDLTGRENVFLQGAIMGMRAREIAAKFDQIVAFSGIEKFIDTPVKRYSSGMNARLGFAVAAHLDPDVLVIDEALAVGDAAFQRRAFDRITELVRRDIPVIVVSHQLDQIATLCTRALVLERGAIVHEGPPADCAAAYLARTFAPAATARASALEVESLGCDQGTSVPSGGRLVVNVQCRVCDPARAHQEALGVRVRAAGDGAVLYATDVGSSGGIALPGEAWYCVDVVLQLNVPPGPYLIETFVWSHAHGCAVAGGPHAVVEVTRGPQFTGAVQMNAAFRLTHAAAYGPERGWAVPDAEPLDGAPAGDMVGRAR